MLYLVACLTNLNLYFYGYGGLLHKLVKEYKEGVDQPTLTQEKAKQFTPYYIANKLREDYEIYSVFYKTFVPAIVGKRFFPIQ